MSEKRIRRFTRIEIVHHWCQAIPYIVLAGTGGMLLTCRALGIDSPTLPTVGIVHRVAGFALIGVWLQIAIVGIYSGDFRELLGSLRESFSWKTRDIVWIFKAPLQIVWPTLQLPPSSRFNAGQKFHLFLIAVVIPLFTISGLVMIFVPGALGAWILHTLLFFPALIFLGVHIFSALINPETRKSFWSIVTGYVETEHARNHHPLWVGGDSDISTKHSPILSRAATATTAVFLGVCVAYGAWCYGPSRLYPRALALIEARGALAILPGDLCAVHANDPKLDRCTSCHRYLGSPPSSSCVDCHDTIQEMMTRKVGFHGTFDGECRSCHGEHGGTDVDIRPLDTQNFNHNLARYPLEGRHTELTCETCHAVDSETSDRRRTRYIGLEFDGCIACHANPHENDRAQDCLRCHTQTGWKGHSLVFNHDRDSHFPLDGKHAKTPCADCHRQPPDTQAETTQLTGLGERCVDCHRDPHRPTLGDDCERCHTADGWSGRHLDFDHDRDSRFPLDGKHAETPCADCHRPSIDAQEGTIQLAGLSERCVDCHRDPHRPTLGDDCERCHTAGGWNGRHLNFDHNRDSAYELRGAHTRVACTECHIPTESDRLASAPMKIEETHCASCHRDPHRDQFKQKCETCHVENGWTGRWLLPAHGEGTTFPLRGAHASTACIECHRPTVKDGALAAARFVDLPHDCEACHTDVHNGQMRSPCATCHTEDGWKGRFLTFSHEAHSEFPIDKIHASVTCAACHGEDESVKYRPLPNDCEGCHIDAVQHLAGQTSILTGAPDPHAKRVSCVRCHAIDRHDPSPLEHAATCRGCHNERYEELFFDWQNALHTREAQAHRLLEQFGSPESSEAKLFAARMRIAKRVSFHNVQLARSIWDDVILPKLSPQ